MLFFLKLLFCFYFIGVSNAKTEHEIKQWFQSLGIECYREHNITPDDMLMLHRHELPNTDTAKCLMACVFRRADWMDSKGMFDTEKANAMVEKEHIDDATKLENSKKLFETCKKVNEESVVDGEKGCDRAGHLFKCLVEYAPKLGFSIM